MSQNQPGRRQALTPKSGNDEDSRSPVTHREQALHCLQPPIFGDARCIEAVAWLEAYEELEDLRKVEHEFECPECDGSGEEDCPHCGQPIDCEVCKGKGSYTSVAEWERRTYAGVLLAGELAKLKERIAEIKAVLG